MAVGFITAAIPGPVFLFFVSRTLKGGFSVGIPIALGATVVDFIYSTIAALGLSAASELFTGNENYIKIFGGLFLIYLAYYELQFDIKADALHLRERMYFKLFLKIFFLNLSNPLTIGSFIGMLAGISNEISSISEAFIIGLGVFFGSSIWFLILGLLIIKIRKRIPIVWLTRIKLFAVVTIGLLGLSTIFGF
jgi:threonine/homoserine/homoserine lactone efflux protein